MNQKSRYIYISNAFFVIFDTLFIYWRNKSIISARRLLETLQVPSYTELIIERIIEGCISFNRSTTPWEKLSNKRCTPNEIGSLCHVPFFVWWVDSLCGIIHFSESFKKNRCHWSVEPSQIRWPRRPWDFAQYSYCEPFRCERSVQVFVNSSAMFLTWNKEIKIN
jgi:hypothetical protein